MYRWLRRGSNEHDDSRDLVGETDVARGRGRHDCLTGVTAHADDQFDPDREHYARAYYHANGFVPTF